MFLRASKEKSFVVVVALLCSIAIIFIGLSIFSIFRNRQSYLNEARIRSRAQAQLLAENSASVIYAVDLTLLSLRSMIRQQSNVSRLPSITAVQIFETELRFLPQIKDVVLLDSKGDVLYSSAGTEKFESATFGEHRDAWLQFSVDAIIAGKDEAKIVLSRRLENQKAEFLGVLAAVVDPDFFYDRFNDYLDIDMDAIALVDMKGRVLTGWFRKSDLGKKFIGADIRVLPHFSSFSGTILSGGGRRTHENGAAIVSTHQLPGFPFHVAVSYSLMNVLKKWRGEATRDIATVFFTTLIAAFTLILAHRHRQRRQKAERELLAHHERLEETVAERTAQLTETNRKVVQKNAALEKALAEVKTLSGLLPICSHCKKIRDDKGYWTQIESYIHEHSEAEFSHSICRECAKKYYPDMDIYDE
jgi:hypothetical protein